jgi:hypothetical protein
MTQSMRGATQVLCLLLVFAGSSAIADSSSITTSWSTGLEYSSGTYGGDEDIEDLYLPVGFSLNLPRLSLDLTVPYLSMRAPAGTTVTDPGGEPVPGSGQTVTESGIGDVIAGITVYDVLYSDRLGLALDIAGRIKFGTADENKGLGTGEQDFTLRTDLYKFFDQVTLLGSIGYKFRGDPEAVDLENVLIASVGGIRYANDTSRLGLILDYRESAIKDGDAVTELSAFFAKEFSETWSLQFYVFTGFSDSSPDWGGGFLLTAT